MVTTGGAAAAGGAGEDRESPPPLTTPATSRLRGSGLEAEPLGVTVMLATGGGRMRSTHVATWLPEKNSLPSGPDTWASMAPCRIRTRPVSAWASSPKAGVSSGSVELSSPAIWRASLRPGVGLEAAASAMASSGSTMAS